MPRRKPPRKKPSRRKRDRRPSDRRKDAPPAPDGHRAAAQETRAKARRPPSQNSADGKHQGKGRHRRAPGDSGQDGQHASGSGASATELTVTHVSQPSHGTQADQQGGIAPEPPAAAPAATPGSGPDSALRPRYDDARREWTLSGALVKRFRTAAASQILVLRAFEAAGWPKYLKNPFPNPGSRAAALRLHETIKSLNHNQIVNLVRLHGDGTRDGLWWELLNPPGKTAASTELG